jgi:hypothetical protein
VVLLLLKRGEAVVSAEEAEAAVGAEEEEVVVEYGAEEGVGRGLAKWRRC